MSFSTATTHMARPWRERPLLIGLIVWYAVIWVITAIHPLDPHYTYARVPLGDWMKDWFGFSRKDRYAISEAA